MVKKIAKLGGRQKAKEWLQDITHEEVDKYQQNRMISDRAGTYHRLVSYGRFHRSDVRKIRQRVIQRVLRDGEEEYGSITVGWLLLVALATCISFAIRRWLEKVFPNRTMSVDYDAVLEEIRKE
jgi:hypothetical protein